jgi:hypothetical protein
LPTDINGITKYSGSVPNYVSDGSFNIYFGLPHQITRFDMLDRIIRVQVSDVIDAIIVTVDGIAGFESLIFLDYSENFREV